LVEKILNFSIEKFDFTEDDPNSQFATARVQAFASDVNEHDMTCSEEVLKKTAPSIFNKPVIYNISKMLNDFGSHTEPDKTLIAGFAVPDSSEFIRLPDNRLSLNVVVKLWKRYAPKVMEILKREGETKVSVEMELKDSAVLPNGLLDMRDFEYSGICLLGQNIREASPGAMLQMLSFSKEKEEFDIALRQEKFDRYGSLDLSILPEIKSACQMGIDLAKQHNKGSSSVSLALARHMLKSDKASPEKIRHMAKVHKSNKFVDMEKDPPSDSYISFLLYGGESGGKWSTELSDKLDQIDGQHLSYFDNSVTFPYSHIEDINPALKGIEPKISLKDANEIASQADAIGADKGGWGIAIKSWKDRHTVKSGRWVAKEKKNVRRKYGFKRIREGGYVCGR
jgi:hypothetical protein